MRVHRLALPCALAALFALPMLAALALAAQAGLDGDAWRALWADPQWPRALALSVWVALASTALALAGALGLTTALHGSPAWQRLARWLGPMLALPHAAFAIGFGLLVMPSGLVARLLAPLAGWASPPDWGTVNDRWGFGLVAVLAAKELPFLLWNIFALFGRPEVEADLQRQIGVVRTLGYDRRAAWWRVLWPQWLPRLALPLAAVFAYSLTVVDLALIIGPASPPTLAVLAWQWLRDADPARNAQGAVTVLALAGVLGLLCALGAALALAARRAWLARVRLGHRPREPAARSALAGGLARALVGLYATVLAMIVAMSVAGVWTFPALWPQVWTTAAWASVAEAAGTVGFTAGLALAASASALLMVVVWLEATPAAWDHRAAPLLMAPIVLPGLLLMVGLYRGALHLGLDGARLGLWWAHTLVVVPYVFVALAPAWRSFDVRYEWTALALGGTRLAFWWRVKWPLLLAPLAAAAAVGFAVSVAQYLPTQFVGAGRHATVTTEAVTLASGGQRTLAAAFALLQALLPALGFGIAHALAQWQRRRLP